MKKYSKFLAVVLAFAMVLPGVAQAAVVETTEGGIEVTRLGGVDRVGTAVLASETAYKDGAESVVLAGFNGEVDALTGTLLAADKNAPLLVTRQAKLTDETKLEIERLKAKTVYILGGEDAVSAAVETELEGLVDSVVRVKGSGREDTAANVAKEVKGTNASDVFLALGRPATEGDALADALAIGPVSAMKKAPVLLAKKDSIPSETVQAMKDLNVKNVTIVGGTSAIAPSVEAALKAEGYTVTRIGESGREKTALKIAETYFADPANLIVAYGRKSADALVGGYMGAKLNAPILLTNNAGLTEETVAYVTANPLSTFVLGGEEVITDTVLKQVVAALEGGEEVELKVESVSAINQTSLKVTGEGLGQLTTADITVEDNNATKVTASADGKSATVELQSALVSEQDVKVTIKENEESTKEFTVTYKFEVTSVTIEDQLFDDDRANQTVKFKVNGVDADMDYLTLNNYNVTFVAKNANTGAADTSLFGANTSTTGVIDNPAVKGAYTVEVQVTKAGEAMVTDTAEVSIVNLDAQTTALEAPVFYNHGADKADDSSAAYGARGTSNDDLLNDDFVQNSTTFVAGEGFDMLRLYGTVAGEKQLIGKGDIVVTSSNDAVVSVDAAKALKAEAAGTATLTFKVGEAVKTVNVTVTNNNRELRKVAATPNSVKLVQTYSKDVVLKATDQYGDPISVAAADVTEVVPENASAVALVSGNITELETDVADSIGTMVATVTGNQVGKGSIFYKDATTGKVLGSVLVDVSDVANLGNLKLERIAGLSTDNNLALNADNTIVYELAQYNTNGVYMEGIDLQGRILEVVDGTIATVQFTSDDGTTLTTGPTVGTGANEVVTAVMGDLGFVVTAKKAGKTDILLKDPASGKQEKFTITVTEDAFEVTNVDFKSAPEVDYAGKTINYKDVLSVIESNDDDILTGVTLNKATEHKVRISEVAGSIGIVYLDVNANGKYNAGTDVPLGVVTISKTASSSITAEPSDAIAGLTTVASDKGTVLFKFLTDSTGADETTAIKATSVSVDVK